MNLKETTERLQRQVYVAEDHVVINIEYEYSIALDRCDTPEKLLYWIWHLCEKTWITPEVIGRFIEVVCKENNIKMLNA